MMSGINETALFLSLFFAGYYVHPVSSWLFKLFNNWFLGLISWTMSIGILFTPGILVSIYLECNHRNIIFLAGLFSGTLLSEILSRRHH
jgi:hypothetical protein